MDKRDFLRTAAIGAVALPSLAQAANRGARQIGPTLLTITGNIGRSNRGPFDPALEYDSKPHSLAGPTPIGHVTLTLFR